MREILKDKKILTLVILVFVFFIIAVGSCSQNRRQKTIIQQEISKRMDLEAQIANFQNQGKGLRENLLTSQQELDEIKQELEVTQKALSQEKLINSSLKKELDKVNKLKQALEEDLGQTSSEETDRKKR
jgi:predicted RNase H-like nuclease (RuvC/YqgF family)